MSGIEIVGIILGAFPLAISAMEHYEESKKVAGTFFKIRRAHRKDLGRIKDCQLKFRLNMKELLLPLLEDDVVTRIEYERLIANPGGPGWQEDHVEDSLALRLGDCHERYIEILKEMEEAMVSLCKATRVDDEQFQVLLKSQNASANTPTERARSQLMTRSYATLQAKKVAYAFTIPQREALLEEIEGFNAKLENVLVANDRIAGFTRQTVSVSTPRKPRIPKALLHFWRHADCMFRLLSQAWTCHCKGLHCARLWLRQRIAATADLKIMLQFCHDTRRCMHIQLAEDSAFSITNHNAMASLRLPLRPIGQNHNVPSIMVQSTNTVTKSSASATTVTVSRTDSRVSWAAGCQQQSINSPAPHKDLCASDLCNMIHTTGTRIGAGECYGGFTDTTSDRYYTVSALDHPSGTLNASGATLAEMLDGKTPITLTRIQRYSIAATLASSLLQLESTPWSQSWHAADVHFAHDQATVLEYDKPFFLTRFNTATIPKDDSFKALGVLLLELCFGRPLDQHEIWQQPGFAMAKANPMMRHFVACEWLKHVEGEAGEQYASAVRFCLHDAPATLKDEKWRTDFAQAVVWPLQQCYESMQPSKRSF